MPAMGMVVVTVVMATMVTECMAMSAIAMVVAMVVRVPMGMVAVTIIGDMTTIGTAFWLKGQISLNHRHVHAA